MERVRSAVAAALFGDPAPRAVGRYELLREIGAGAMGVVYAAHDPQLGRTIALKLIQGETGDRARARLLREAQAMARLKHPNVLAVHDAGTHGDQVYIAMEYAEDGSLLEWMLSARRSWREVLDVLTQAGRGLAAAHAAGLVHRDFKPANILLGHGRVRVSDFGLARVEDSGETPHVDELEATLRDGKLALDTRLTRTGMMVGTPAYMAPEQLAGGPATAKSDQFAFCVVLHEALYGRRPYHGSSAAELLAHAQRGRPDAPPRGAGVPARLHAALLRGLSPQPERRWPAMDVLLTELARASDRPRVHPGVVLAAGLGAGLLGIFSMRPSAEVVADAPASCDAELAAWSPERAELLRSAFTGLPELSAQGPALSAALDRYAATWRELAAARCGERDASPSTSLAWPDLCLADRREALGDLVDVLTTADPPLRAHGLAAAEQLLPPVEECAGETPQPLLGGGPVAERHARWRYRIAFAEAFLPRALTRPGYDVPDTSLTMFPTALRDPRMRNELMLATIVQRHHEGARDDARSQASALADSAEHLGHHDLAARALALHAELLEAGPHTDADVLADVERGATALKRLHARHPLHIDLSLDLGVIALAHARHTSEPGACVTRAADFARCAPIFRAVDLLQSADRALVDQRGEQDPLRAVIAGHLADALAHQGAAELADTARARAASLRAGDCRDCERVYLDMREGSRLTAAAPQSDGALERLQSDAATAIRCSQDLATCELDREFVARLLARPQVFEDLAIMPSVRDGVFRGHKLYKIRPTSLAAQLGFKNGDLLVELDGRALDGGTFDPRRLFAGERVALVVERKGERLARELVIR